MSNFNKNAPICTCCELEGIFGLIEQQIFSCFSGSHETTRISCEKVSDTRLECFVVSGSSFWCGTIEIIQDSSGQFEIHLLRDYCDDNFQLYEILCNKILAFFGKPMRPLRVYETDFDFAIPPITKEEFVSSMKILLQNIGTDTHESLYVALSTMLNFTKRYSYDYLEEVFNEHFLLVERILKTVELPHPKKYNKCDGVSRLAVFCIEAYSQIPKLKEKIKASRDIISSLEKIAGAENGFTFEHTKWSACRVLTRL